jgi:Protein of unknown function (DUF559)
MARDLDGAIAERSRTLLGLLTVAHLDALGVSRQQRRTLVARGVLIPVHGRVFRHAAHPQSWRQSTLAAVLAAGDGAVASHLTAAALWRFDTVTAGAIEVSVPAARRATAGGFVVHRSCDLLLADRQPHVVISRTTPARTLCDIAPLVTARQLEAALDDAERRRLVWRPHLWWRVDELRRQGRRGVGRVEALLRRTEGRQVGDTWLETEGMRIIARAGLPTPRCQVTLRKRGSGIARVDLFWDHARLAVELDGHATHATRRQRQASAERASRLKLAGWDVVTFTYEDVVERPEYVVEAIRAHLGQAS